MGIREYTFFAFIVQGHYQFSSSEVIERALGVMWFMGDYHFKGSMVTTDAVVYWLRLAINSSQVRLPIDVAVKTTLGKLFVYTTAWRL